MSPPVVVGIIGGVASGKSEVTRQLEALGALVIHADAIGHEVLREPDVIEALVARFGIEILNPENQQIDRSQVAARVFGHDHPMTENRRYLESVVHPRIRAKIRDMLERLHENPQLPMIVLDVPLLLESGWDSMCDRVLFVDAPDEVRWQRARLRGWSEHEFRDRERAQLAIEKKRESATDVIANAGSLAELSRAIDRWWRSMVPR